MRLSYMLSEFSTKLIRKDCTKNSKVAEVPAVALNAPKIISRYGDGTREENRSSGDRSDYLMEYKYTKRILDRYIATGSTVLEIGCGTGYYGRYLADKCSHYTGVDITPGNIDVFNKKVAELGLSNVKGFTGDAINLEEIADDSFDVVLNFGPLYHLPPAERELVFKESKRVCKSQGIVMFAYINKIGVYLGRCLNEPEKYPNRQKNVSILKKGMDDTREDIYWFAMPEEMEDAAVRNGLIVVENLGVDFVFVPQMHESAEENKESWEELSDFLCASESCAGFSNHAVMVCKKAQCFGENYQY